MKHWDFKTETQSEKGNTVLLTPTKKHCLIGSMKVENHHSDIGHTQGELCIKIEKLSSKA